MFVHNQFGPATWRALCFKVVGHASNACLDFVYDQSRFTVSAEIS